MSFLAALLLWYFSISDVKGFAFTLGLTTIIDVVVVFLFTKPMVTILARTKFFSSGHPLSGLDPARSAPGRPGGRECQERGPPLEGGMMASLGQLGGRLYRGEVSINFVGRQRTWYTISGLILLIAIVALSTRWLNFSVNFKGGSVLQFGARCHPRPAAQRGGQLARGQPGDSPARRQRQRLADPERQAGLRPAPAGGARNTQQRRQGPWRHRRLQSQLRRRTWGSEITGKALKALIVFLVVIVIYLSITLMEDGHRRVRGADTDIVITVGVYSLFGFTVSPASVIGLLTILGYSLYDTVVVFDKVRENTAGLLGPAGAPTARRPTSR